jgi:hypothetical protein
MEEKYILKDKPIQASLLPGCTAQALHGKREPASMNLVLQETIPDHSTEQIPVSTAPLCGAYNLRRSLALSQREAVI